MFNKYSVTKTPLGEVIPKEAVAEIVKTVDDSYLVAELVNYIGKTYLLDTETASRTFARFKRDPKAVLTKDDYYYRFNFTA